MLSCNVAQIKRVFNAQLQTIFSLPRFYTEKSESSNYRVTGKVETHGSKDDERMVKRPRRRFVKGCGEEDCRHVAHETQPQNRDDSDTK